MNTKSKKIRLCYSIAFSALTVLLGAFFIFAAFRIFAVGGYAQGAYSRVVVGKWLLIIAIPFVIWVAGVVAAFVLHVKLPVERKRFAMDRSPQLLKRLLPRVPEDADAVEIKKILHEERLRFIAGVGAAVVYIVCIVFAAIYVFDKDNFPADDLNGEMLAMFLHVAPWLALACIFAVALMIFCKYSTKRELAIVKSLVASNKSKSPVANPLLADKLYVFRSTVTRLWTQFRHVMATDVAKWSVRGCVFVVAVGFVILGVFNDGMRDVLIKAINICTECIGLG